MLTLLPVLAAVGLLAWGPVVEVARGDVSLGRADRTEIAELVDAADERRRRLNPLDSGAAAGGAVELRSRWVGDRGMREDDATDIRDTEISLNEIAREVVRGIPARVAFGVMRRGTGEVDKDKRSSSLTLISAHHDQHIPPRTPPV